MTTFSNVLNSLRIPINNDWAHKTGKYQPNRKRSGEEEGEEEEGEEGEDFVLDPNLAIFKVLQKLNQDEFWHGVFGIRFLMPWTVEWTHNQASEPPGRLFFSHAKMANYLVGYIAHAGSLVA